MAFFISLRDWASTIALEFSFFAFEKHYCTRIENTWYEISIIELMHVPCDAKRDKINTLHSAHCGVLGMGLTPRHSGEKALGYTKCDTKRTRIDQTFLIVGVN